MVDLTDQQIRAITSEFNINFSKKSRIKEAIVSSVYILDDIFVLRSQTLEGVRTVNQLRLERKLIKSVRGNTHFLFPDLMKNKSGDFFFFQENVAWMIYPIIPGKTLCTWYDLYKLNDDERKNIFLALRQLHNDTRGVYNGIVENSFVKLAEEKLEQGEEWLPMDQFKKIKKALKVIESTEKSILRKDCCFIHGDFHAGNIIFNEKSEISGFVDTDLCSFGPFYQDLAYSIELFLVDYRHPVAFDPKILRKYAGLYGVSEVEYKILLNYIIWYAYREAWFFNDSGFLPNQKFYFEYQKNMLRILCNEIG